MRVMNCKNCQLYYQPVTIENYLLPTHTDHYYHSFFNCQRSGPESLQP